jgi:hypothetical protein
MVVFFNLAVVGASRCPPQNVIRYTPSIMADQQPPDFNKLIPELSAWNSGAGIDVGSWLSCSGSLELAIAFSTLFWPRFVLFDGCVLFEGFSTGSFDGFMRQTNPNRAGVESVMNHHHLMDLFSHAAGAVVAEPSCEQLEYLGSVLRDAWETKVSRDFPDRKFIVSFDRGSPDDLLEYIVTFYQPANRPGV